jgi:hypothetical protein
LFKSEIQMNEPLLGEMLIKHCNSEIRSIDLQLIRVETRGDQEGLAKDCKYNQLFGRFKCKCS